MIAAGKIAGAFKRRAPRSIDMMAILVIRSNQQSMEKSFRSKVDTRFGAILILMPLVLAFVAWELSRKPLPFKWGLIVAIGLIGVCLPLSLLLRTRYTVSERSLKIRHGFFSWTIPLSEMTSISPAKDPASSPALSLDRLRIEYAKGKSIMISPLNKEEFVNLLRSLGVPAS